jgi:L-aspartate semialdehyde sulfurtransferase ferredoxin
MARKVPNKKTVSSTSAIKAGGTAVKARPVRTAKPARRLKPLKTKKAVKAAKAARRTRRDTPTQQRLWLMYPPRLIQKPLIWQLGNKFKITTNIRQASVTDEIGIVCLEVTGKRAELKASIRWLEKHGVSVEPVEISVLES